MKVHKPEFFDMGDTWELEGRLAYADGTPFNLNPGCAIQWALQDSTGSNVLSFVLGSGITVLDANGGICLITVPPIESAGILVGQYTDQCRATDPNGYVSTQFQGTINVNKSFFS